MLYLYFLSLTISLLQSLPYTLSADMLSTSSGNQTVFPGQSARFKCQFDTPNGLQSPQYFEYRDPGSGFLKLETGTPDWNFTFASTGDTRAGPDIVEIYQISPSNHGLEISCTFKNVTSTAFLFVYQPPILSLAGGDYYEVIEYRPLFVIFDTLGYPDPKYAQNYSWYHNGEILTDSPSLQLTASSINLINSLRSNHGSYTLNTSTIAGNTSAMFFLNVTYPPEISGDREFRETVVEGFSKTLVCGGDILANPNPTFSWTKIESDNTSSILSSQSNSLTLSNVTRSDNGMYVCNVSNHLGSLSVSVSLAVFYPSSAPEWSDVTVGATEIDLQWTAPADAQMLSVDLYEVTIFQTESYTTLIRTNVSGDILRTFFSHQTGLKIYPDTNYSLQILAYTFNSAIRGEQSSPYSIRTLVSTPIIDSISARIIDTYILIQWELFSSGKSNRSVDNYLVTISRENISLVTIRTRSNKIKFYKFESHSIYRIGVSGVRNGSRGEPIRTSLETNSNGPPPILISISTKSIDMNTVRVNVDFSEVLIPYESFKTKISCQNPPFSVLNTHRNFTGGILTLSLRIPSQYRDFNCTLLLTNKFGNRTYYFSFSHLENVTRPLSTTSTFPSKPRSSINIPLIICITILIVLVFIAFIIACIVFAICFFYKKSNVYRTAFSYEKKMNSPDHDIPKESFDNASIENGEEKIEISETKVEYNV